MTWESEPTRPGFVSGTADAKDWNALASQFREFLLMTAEVVAARMAGKRWDRLYFDFIVSQGKIAAYPHTRGDPISARACEVTIYSPLALDEYNAVLGDEDSYPDDEALEFAVGKVRNRMGMALDKFKNKQDVRQAYRELRKGCDFTSWTIKDGDIEAVVPYHFI
jgi:hypothetical protein